jgi:putative PIN family toxin of toxin-antitoxin system
MSEPCRVVLDTNVLLSALIFGGKPRAIVEMLAKRKIEVAISEAILTEMRRKIARKFSSFLNELPQMELLLEQDAEVVKLGAITIDVCRDPDDNHILETAILGNCRIIVTGDKGLLVLKKYQGVSILTPADFTDNFKN